MSSLVLELQRDAMNNQVSVSDLVRKSLAVATKLNMQEFKAWAESELRGVKKDEVPPYRLIKGELKAYNPYNGYWMPVIFEDGKTGDILSTRSVSQSIGELESLVTSGDGKGMLNIPFSQEQLVKIFPKYASDGIAPTVVIAKTRICGIIETVRNIILEWSLKLEKDGIYGEELKFSDKEKEKAAQTIYNIQNFTGVIGDVNTSEVQIGDFNSINASLKEKGVSESEREELKTILNDLKKAKDGGKKSLLQRGTDWLRRNGPLIGSVLYEIIKRSLGIS
ncbi:MAG: hypothetical protein NTY47_06350 [Candidatus Omnitrophica bacterium]|nr:hypothetical protein [Candidatus Omnitrophota bacterium]